MLRSECNQVSALASVPDVTVRRHAKLIRHSLFRFGPFPRGAIGFNTSNVEDWWSMYHDTESLEGLIRASNTSRANQSQGTGYQELIY